MQYVKKLNIRRKIFLDRCGLWKTTWHIVHIIMAMFGIGMYIVES